MGMKHDCPSRQTAPPTTIGMMLNAIICANFIDTKTVGLILMFKKDEKAHHTYRNDSHPAYQ